MKYVPETVFYICCLVLIVLTVGEPDLLDAITASVARG